MEASEDETIRPPITLQQLMLQLHHPPPSQSPLFQNNSSHPSFFQSLSYIPWKIVPIGQNPSTTVAESTSDDAPTSTPTQGSSSSLSFSSFPKEDYLDFRRQQNLAWAEDRLVKGNEQYYLDATKADEYYQEGLKLCPDHVPLLVAQAKLWIFRRNRPQAAKTQLEHCLRLEPHHPDAQDLLDRWNRMDAARKGGGGGSGGVMHSQSNKGLPQMRETSSAFQNALMERNLAMNSSTMILDLDENDTIDEKKFASDNEDDRDSDRRHSNHKKKKKRKSKKRSKHSKKHDKKKKRRKRRRHDSSSEDETDDDGDSIVKDESDRSSTAGSLEETSERRHSRHPRHHRRKGRENRDKSSPVDDSSANDSHRKSSRHTDVDDGTKHPNGSVS